MRFDKTVVRSCLALYLVGQIGFLIGIQFPHKINFDEFHYVPAAKSFLEGKLTTNLEHPLLGKVLMAGGIALFGDKPIGWRFMSTVFGALTLVGMYLWGLALFRKQETALIVAGLTLFNHLLYVQSRIGMLDTFMFAFIVWALAAFTWLWRTDIDARSARQMLKFVGVMLGLATACKWYGLIPWILCLSLYLGTRVFKKWGVTFSKPQPEQDFYSPGILQGIRTKDIVISLGVIPIVTYFITFLPYLAMERTPAYTLWDLVKMQPEAWDAQGRVVNTHPYMSKWSQWITMTRPIWYAFDKEHEAQGWVRGVVLLGNPFIMWGGLVALGVCAWGWITRRTREPFLVLAFYLGLFLSWVIIPRKVAFYYYYYPAGCVLSLAMAYVAQNYLKNRWARWGMVAIAAGFFFWFFPILAALKIQDGSYMKWMWMRSWI